MRKSLLAIPVLVLTGVAALAAEPSGHQKSGKTAPSGKLLPLKGATSSNSCAAYGAGFVRVEGTETCAKIGGAVSIGAGTSAGSR
ncbi:MULTISPECIES: porin [unclassified Bradyrhizobium]|uniref:porin n=1 Tax=unclassified Bradyrhizobium TaxID=2631580 RepID=UPI001BAA9FD6|nr:MULTISPECIES: porin [unclassified Bradyrhizobium]MBR1227238.1 porin [Bradyrhizobium sp. AUGA SZCCT0176]MBR1298680.1 porin [Bradyrhizobium sp. AUGA SZCCT0042]